MSQALALGESARANGEVPVGAIIVKNDRIIGQGNNRTICDHDASAHAEIVALRQAGVNLKNHRLIDSTLYVTLEPCIMCAGAILQARIKRLVFAARDEKFGAAGSQLNLLQSPFLNHTCEIQAGVMDQECKALLQNFFLEKRN